MAFWGVEVKPGKATPFVPPPEESSQLHVSQACLNIGCPAGQRCALRVRVGDGEPLLVCALRENGQESIGLDLIFDQYTEFTVEGPASIHVTGYFVPHFGADESEEEEEEEGFPGDQILGYDEYGVPVLASEYNSEEDSDYQSESDEEDEAFESSDEEGGAPRFTIEDITEMEIAASGRRALPAPERSKGGKKKQQAAAANGSAVAVAQANGKPEFGDEDVDASDGAEESSGEEEESSEGDGESGSEEDEEQPEPQQEQPRAQKQPQEQQAGQKRKGEAPKQQPAEKAAKLDGKQQGKAPAPAQAQQTPKQAKAQQQAAAEAAPPSSGKRKVRTFPNGFEIEDVRMGRPDGKLAKAGKKVVVKYRGSLKSSGKVFDETKGNKTFSFRLGVGEVIKGWDRGVEGMRVGDKRRLSVPPQMAYGTQGIRGTIPPNSWLLFDVELVDVK